MFYSFPETIVVSYLGGTFGNSLAMLVDTSRTRKVKQPNRDTCHIKDWPIEDLAREFLL